MRGQWIEQWFRARPWQIEPKMGVLLASFGIILLVCNLALMLQNQQLKRDLALRTETMRLKPGDPLPPLRGLDPSGRQLTIRYDDPSRETILFVFSPGCRWCELNMANWRVLLEALDERHYRFVFVSVDPRGVQQYLHEHGINMSDFTVIAEPDPRDRVNYKFSIVPQTIAVGTGGVVRAVWLGALQGEQRQSVERYFSIRFPARERW